MNLKNIIIGICSLLFLMVGTDKFFAFLKPPCSLMDSIPTVVWQILGGLQVAAGILIWLPKFRKFIVGFFTLFMFVFTIVHLSQKTYDVGGSVFMGILLALLVWNPSFMQGQK